MQLQPLSSWTKQAAHVPPRVMHPCNNSAQLARLRRKYFWKLLPVQDVYTDWLAVQAAVMLACAPGYSSIGYPSVLQPCMSTGLLSHASTKAYSCNTLFACRPNELVQKFLQEANKAANIAAQARAAVDRKAMGLAPAPAAAAAGPSSSAPAGSRPVFVSCSMDWGLGGGAWCMMHKA